ncbi:protein Son-like [Wyeomyia smithii]|uniref:protein Son-like n=1 Tax=Wyeomyia smithii TaxID=174621 RepID=UPI0024681C7A|nr:protein Son-like [Wyeomyia smithii]
MYSSFGSRRRDDNYDSSYSSEYRPDTSVSSYNTAGTTYYGYVNHSASLVSYDQGTQSTTPLPPRTNYSYGSNESNYTSEPFSPVYSTNVSYGVQPSDSSRYVPAYANAVYSAVTSGVGQTESSTSKRQNATQQWVRSDSLRQAAPIAGGNGMRLLQKMGWCPGEGLGKRKDGSLEPHLPYIKTNKRGLDVSRTLHQNKSFRNSQKNGGPRAKPKRTLITEGKHPISILAEYCSKQKWDPPIYQAVVDEGPIHAKNYVFKVTVNGTEYKAETGSNIKQSAKSEAAMVFLRKFNIIHN